MTTDLTGAVAHEIYPEDGWETWPTSATWNDADNDYVFRMEIETPRGFVLTPEIKAMLQAAYWAGHEHGVTKGKRDKATEIRTALGINDAIDWKLSSGGYVSKYDER